MKASTTKQLKYQTMKLFYLTIKRTFLLVFWVSSYSVYAQKEQPFQGNVTLTYEEAILAFQDFANSSELANLIEAGLSDAGTPMHLLIIDSDGAKKPDEISSEKVRIWINNGIHPGEPCGVDASTQLIERVLSAKKSYEKLLDKVTLLIVPIYNVGGALNRTCCSRANQNGPEMYGFRGNARNLDLNRDFIKCDSRNAQWFNQTFTAFDPHMMIDTHTSNGADYQYVMTMINTQADKASEKIGEFIRKVANPEIYSMMEERGWGMTPYVHTMHQVPDDGIMDFLETPRYSTGYAALSNCIGYTSETHMLKPFAQRVESTYQFIVATLDFANEHAAVIIQNKIAADEQVAHQKEFALQWELDTATFREINFKGYEAAYPISEVTGKKQLRYSRAKPYEKPIRFYDRFIPTVTVEAPEAYVLPQAWHEVIDRLKWNGVLMFQVETDLEIDLEVYYIQEFESAPRVYEGHHVNTLQKLDKVTESIKLRKGDYVIPVDQVKNRYIVEMLEPQGVDAFFVWNFFDSALQQKEWYSDYVFEATAEMMLEEDDELRKTFEEKKKTQPEFAEDAKWQLYWLYRRSPNAEPVNRFPVYRMLGNKDLIPLSE